MSVGQHGTENSDYDLGESLEPTCSPDTKLDVLSHGLNSADLQCPICVEIIRDPFVTSCGHTFCYKCITTHLRHKKNCPSCGHYITQEHLYPNFLLNKLLRKVVVHPPHPSSLLDAVQAVLVGQSDPLCPRDIDEVIVALQERRQQLEQQEGSQGLHLLLMFLHAARHEKQQELVRLQAQLHVLDQDMSAVLASHHGRSATAAAAPGVRPGHSQHSLRGAGAAGGMLLPAAGRDGVLTSAAATPPHAAAHDASSHDPAMMVATNLLATPGIRSALIIAQGAAPSTTGEAGGIGGGASVANGTPPGGSSKAGITSQHHHQQHQQQLPDLHLRTVNGTASGTRVSSITIGGDVPLGGNRPRRHSAETVTMHHHEADERDTGTGPASHHLAPQQQQHQQHQAQNNDQHMADERCVADAPPGPIQAPTSTGRFVDNPSSRRADNGPGHTGSAAGPSSSTSEEGGSKSGARAHAHVDALLAWYANLEADHASMSGRTLSSGGTGSGGTAAAAGGTPPVALGGTADSASRATQPAVSELPFTFSAAHAAQQSLPQPLHHLQQQQQAGVAAARPALPAHTAALFPQWAPSTQQHAAQLSAAGQHGASMLTSHPHPAAQAQHHRQQHQQHQQQDVALHASAAAGRRDTRAASGTAAQQLQQNSVEGQRAGPSPQGGWPTGGDNVSAARNAKRKRIASHFDDLEQAYLSIRFGSGGEGSAAAAGSTAAALPAGGSDASGSTALVAASGTAVGPTSNGAASLQQRHHHQHQGEAVLEGSPSHMSSLACFSDVLSAVTRYSRLNVVAEVPLQPSASRAEGRPGSQVLSSIEFDLDDQFFATAGVMPRISIYDFAAVVSAGGAAGGPSLSLKPVMEIPTRRKLSCLSYSAAHKGHLLSSDCEGGITLWDTSLPTATPIAEYEAHERRIWAVDFSTVEPRCFVSGSDDGLVKIWSTQQRHSLLRLEIRANVCSVQYNPLQSHLLAVGSAAHNVLTYDLRQPREPLQTLVGHRKAVSYVRWLNGTELVSASTDSTLRLWTGGTDAAERVFGGHANEKNFVGLSLDSDIIACGSETNEVYLYHKGIPKPIMSHTLGRAPGAATAAAVPPPPPPPGGGHFVSGLCWRSSSQHLLAANSQGTTWVLALAN